MKKTLKTRAFISAVAMLVVSAIVLVSSTFAWFSMARQVEVEKMTLTVTSPEGIQLSANTNAFTTQLTLEDLNPTASTTSRFKAIDGHSNHFPKELIPSSSIMQTRSAFPTFYQASVSEDGILTASAVSLANSGVIGFDVYLKVSAPQTVYWNRTTVKAVANGNQEVVYAARVALLPCGSSTDPDQATSILQVKNGDVQLFEPIAYQHAADAVAKGYATNGQKKETKYLNSAITAGNRIDVTGSYVTDNGSLAFVTSAGTVANENDNQENMKFNLPIGITRVRVYMWMEGNDIDCLQSVGGSQLDFNLVFSLDQ